MYSFPEDERFPTVPDVMGRSDVADPETISYPEELLTEPASPKRRRSIVPMVILVGALSLIASGMIGYAVHEPIARTPVYSPTTTILPHPTTTKTIRMPGPTVTRRVRTTVTVRSTIRVPRPRQTVFITPSTPSSINPEDK